MTVTEQKKHKSKKHEYIFNSKRASNKLVTWLLKSCSCVTAMALSARLQPQSKKKSNIFQYHRQKE